MKFFAKPMCLLIPAVFTASCGTTFFSELGHNDQICFDNNGDTIECSNLFLASPPLNIEDKPINTTLFYSKTNFVLLNEYVEQMAMKLGDDLRGINVTSSIVVTSFVFLDSSLKNTNTLGNQIAESFIGELKAVGLPVNDIKVTGAIQVTPLGDFALSRNSEELKLIQNVGYVLTGTMVNNDKGIVINARIVGMTSNRVIASTSKFIPNIILSEI
jgi:TolB-like protein